MEEEAAPPWQMDPVDRRDSEQLAGSQGGGAPDATGRRSLSYWSNEEKESFMDTYRVGDAVQL